MVCDLNLTGPRVTLTLCLSLPRKRQTTTVPWRTAVRFGLKKKSSTRIFFVAAAWACGADPTAGRGAQAPRAHTARTGTADLLRIEGPPSSGGSLKGRTPGGA